MEKLIKALRCSSSWDAPKNCLECEYKILEKVDEKLPVEPNIKIAGEEYWVSCDCDRIANEAADQLEKVFYGHQSNACRKGV